LDIVVFFPCPIYLPTPPPSLLPSIFFSIGDVNAGGNFIELQGLAIVDGSLNVALGFDKCYQIPDTVLLVYSIDNKEYVDKCGITEFGYSFFI